MSKNFPVADLTVRFLTSTSESTSSTKTMHTAYHASLRGWGPWLQREDYALSHLGRGYSQLHPLSANVSRVRQSHHIRRADRFPSDNVSLAWWGLYLQGRQPHTLLMSNYQLAGGHGEPPDTTGKRMH